MSPLKSNTVTDGKPAWSRSSTSANSQLYGDAEPATSEGTTNPTDEFRRVTVLLSLLAVINRQGRQVAAVESPDWMIAHLERNIPPHRLALNAFTILLVRGHEGVAVATADHDISRDSGLDHLPTGSNLHILAMQEPAPIAEADPSSHGFWNSNPDAQYMVLPRGTSAWKAVSKDAWSQV
jgi:hypothetical protein